MPYNRAIRSRPGFFVLMVQTVVVLAAIAVLVGFLGSLALDRGWFAGLDSWRLAAPPANGITRLFVDITWFGTVQGVVVSSLILLTTLLIMGYFQPAAVFVFNVLTAAAANSVLKEWVGRERPIHTGVVDPAGMSFPSGHAFVGTAVYGLFALLLLGHFPSRNARAVIIGLTIVFLGAMGFSRLYLGVHYPSDVLAGYVLGLFWAGLFARTAVIRRG